MLIKLFEYYKNLSKPVKASFWFIISNILLRGVSFLTLPIFSRLLTPAEYGVLSVYASGVSLVSIITTLTIWGGVFDVAMAKYSEIRDTVLSSFQGLSICLTSVCFLIVLFFIDELSQAIALSPFLICCMFIEVMMTIPYLLWSSRQRYEYEYKKLILTSAFVAIASPVLGIIAIQYTVYRAEAKIVAGLFVQILLGLTFFISNHKKGKVFYRHDLWKYAFSFNVVLIPHYLSLQILNQSDRIMINKMSGSEAVGLYSIAYNFGMLLQLITSAVESSLTPFIFEQLKSGDTQKLKKQINIVVLFVAIIAIGMICIVPDIFTWMLPDSYYEAMWLIPPIIAGMFFVFIYPLFASIEMYYEEKKYVTVASIIVAFINLIANYVFISLYGYIAAAYTTLGCYILLSVCHYMFMCKVLRINNQSTVVFDIKFITLIGLFVTVFSLGIIPLYNKFLIRWGIILGIAVLILFNRQKVKQILEIIF